MFKLGFIRSILLAHIHQPLLKGTLFVEYELVLQRVPAVKIPGGLTPPLILNIRGLASTLCSLSRESLNKTRFNT
jgi:hypothetical protein